MPPPPYPHAGDRSIKHSTISTLFRRFSWAMGLTVIVLTLVLLYLQSGLQNRLNSVQEDFMPRWQAAQRLQGDAHNVKAKASQLTLAFTLGELLSMRAELDDQILTLETDLQGIITRTTDRELAHNLSVAASDFRRVAEELAEAVRVRVTSVADSTAQQIEQRRRRERDLAYLMGDHSIRLASYSGMLAADIDSAFAAYRRNLLRRLWLQGLFIGLAGVLFGVLIWQQFRLLDHRLIRRIKTLEADMAKTDFDRSLLAQRAAIDEIDAMHNELAGLLNRLTDQNAELERLATTDVLTGLANRRSLFENLEQETYRARRYGAPFSLVLLDVDHFKRINDNWGHAVGDRVLREIARTTHAVLRKTDIAGRYGGEEFLVLLPDTDLEEATSLAQRLNQKIAQEVVTPEQSSPRAVTVSIGVALLAPDESGEELIQRADQALYRAKQSGRNRVEKAFPPFGPRVRERA
jgi:diguanylate cyclase (GGDEF)-like protein